MDERGGAGGGGKSKFSVENFCLTVPETSMGESFSVSLISAIEKVWIRGRGGLKIFRRKISDSRSQKTSYKNPSVFH